jgi:16S rRNA (guanine527-N7)-methyltransferase
MSSAGRVIDVGSGGGFPGLVLASVAPTTEVVLIEPLQKRARLLQEMAGELALANVTVLPVRAEEAGQSPLRESAYIVTARAVAPLPELLEYTAPMARVGGVLVLPKGSGLDAELEAAHHAEEVLGVEFRGTHAMRPEISETLVIALFAKVSQTPAAYPRRPGVAAKRPL